MPIVFYCSSCGKRLKAPDDSAGRRVPCPKCGNPIDVPGEEKGGLVDTFTESLKELSGRVSKAGQAAAKRLQPFMAKAQRSSRKATGRRPRYMPSSDGELGLEEFASVAPGVGRLANLNIGLDRKTEAPSVWLAQLTVGVVMFIALVALAFAAIGLAGTVYNGGDPGGFVRDLISGGKSLSIMWGLGTDVAMTVITLVILSNGMAAVGLLPEGRTAVRAGIIAMLVVVLANMVVLVVGAEIGFRPVEGHIQGVMHPALMVLYGMTCIGALVAFARTQDAFTIKGPGEHDIVDLVDRLLSEALRVAASDVHVEPTVGSTIVRYRIDGVLHSVAEYPPAVAEKAAARIKVLGSMDIAERRLPQDGGAKMDMGDRTIDLRISTVPSEYGERVVIRLLDPETGLMGFEALGMDERMINTMQDVINSPHGVFFSTGPTGSGKTTTLYAALMRANRSERNVITVEDPIEYRLTGIAQLPVGRKKGMNFASGLRSILRQDPDVIMVGEVRDEETARMVVEAAQTGHLVLSTLHTNDSAGAVTRLLDLGIEPFLLASCLTAVLAQRLVRTICPECKQPYVADSGELAELGIKLGDEAPPTFYRGRGCANCMETGYRGRIGLYELLVVDEEIRNLITKSVDAGTIRTVALERGMVDLRTDGARKVMAGLTTVDEVKRMTLGKLSY